MVLGKASYSWKVLGWASTPISTTSSNHIKIEVCGSQIKVYLNDMNIPKIIAYDSSYTSGELGFRTCNADAEFDNLVIKETPNALYSYDQLYQFKKDLFEMQMSDNPIEKGKYIAKYFYDRWFTWWGEKNTENASAMGMPKEYAEIYGDFQSLLLVQGFTQVTVNGVRAYKNIRTGEIVYDSEALKGSSSEGVGKTVFTTTEDAANVLGKELNGTVSQLKNGYKVEIPNGNKPIVVRVMNEGSGGRANPYYRVSIDGKGSLTLDGTLSSDRGLTHIDMTDDYLSQIETMINKYLGK